VRERKRECVCVYCGWMCASTCDVFGTEQVFPADLVRDTLALLSASPAGLSQVDLLELLGSSYPVDDDADDDHNASINPSPLVSPRSPEGADRVARRRGGEEDETDGGGGEEATSGDAVHLQISGSGFGCPLPTPQRRHGVARQGKAGGEGAERGEASTGWVSSARARLGPRGWREATNRILRRQACEHEGTCVVVSGGAFGSSTAPQYDEGDGAELKDMHGPAQDSQTFVRLLRYGSSSCGANRMGVWTCVRLLAPISSHVLTGVTR